jgi:hypothetical protein
VRSIQEAPRRFSIGSGELEAFRSSTQVPLKSVDPTALGTDKKTNPTTKNGKRIAKISPQHKRVKSTAVGSRELSSGIRRGVLRNPAVPETLGLSPQR